MLASPQAAASSCANRSRWNAGSPNWMLMEEIRLADLQFIRHAHAAMELHRLVGDKLAGIADLRLDARGKPREGRVFAGKVELHRNALPLLSEGTNLLLEGPGVAGLLIELPVGLAHSRRTHQAIGIEIFDRLRTLPADDELSH